MERKVAIETHQIVKQEDSKEKFTNHVDGTLTEKNATFIRYNEAVDNADVNVTVKIANDAIKIIRKGDINMTLHFKEGQPTKTFYHLPEGKILLVVNTLSIIHFVSETGGKLKVHYELYQDDEKMGTYQYEIKYKEINDELN
ncbi:MULTISPECIES: DUF1934 domain-containing protein [Staphylococcus]|uniref:DUF1934 domain-containing protein n=2 Tax=Staphylococcaceae TaxID=90964 RepID=A0AAX0ZGY1_STACR|nr:MULTISPECIES: DUF1934 family protein [Staphylococcus]KDP13980.1 hypothetical protein SCHR_02380 [Staphylococcus chromogenes MU 970]MBP0046819.1 DUF1934 family protein [Staphylococcus chromogenes]MBV5138048.1 DUF1934 family protein [Staphylococcus chromogenes]MBW6088165.1 DUF1934 family protein [Staphylococcus chromogenes]MCD8904490.1 DUF1934 family protein [Staphylococcus chromogenes]